MGILSRTTSISYQMQLSFSIRNFWWTFSFFKTSLQTHISKKEKYIFFPLRPGMKSSMAWYRSTARGLGTSDIACLLMTDKKLYFNSNNHKHTVLCSSPSLTWNVCSKMEYMILPMPKEGSMTLGTTSSTVGDKQRKLPLDNTVDRSHQNFKALLLAPERLNSAGKIRSSRSNLTMQSLLESFHTDHVLCELEGFAFCLNSELSGDTNKWQSTVQTSHQATLRCVNGSSTHPVSLSSFSWSVM